jgi:hypothetical protein
MLKGIRTENLEKAIEQHCKALELIDRQSDPQSRATVQHNLGRDFLIRAQLNGNPSDFDESIAHYESALEKGALSNT